MSPAAPINVVEANLDDPRHQRAVLDLIAGYAGSPTGGGTPLSEDVRARLVPELRRQGHRLVLLAEADGEMVGIAVCFRGFSTFHARPLLNIHDLAVRPDYQRQGVGRRLLAEVEQRARQLGCCRVTLEVLASNTVARRLYRSLGFRGEAEESDRNFFLIKKL